MSQYIPFDKQDRTQLHKYIETSYEYEELDDQVNEWELDFTSDPMAICMALEMQLGRPLAKG